MPALRKSKRNNSDEPSDGGAAAAGVNDVVSTAGNNNEAEEVVDAPSTVATVATASSASTATAASSLTEASSAATEEYINRLLASNKRLMDENTTLRVEVSAVGRKRTSQGKGRYARRSLPNTDKTNKENVHTWTRDFYFPNYKLHPSGWKKWSDEEASLCQILVRRVCIVPEGTTAEKYWEKDLVPALRYKLQQLKNAFQGNISSRFMGV